jgi:peptidoglycan/LPS O-acetylase OafA/YrhL
MNHFNILTESAIPMLPRIFGGVGSFFTISGYLMFSSYEKHQQLKGYVVRRIKRIYPPYAFIVIAAALGLSALSSCSLWEYVTDLQFYKYLICNLTFLNFLQPSLPGVFEGDNFVMAAVNGSLWTMKGEVICYFSVPIIFSIIKKYPKRATAILGGLIAICFSLYIALSTLSIGGGSIEILAKQFRVYTFFYTGAMINLHFDKFMRFKWQLLVVILVMIGIASTNDLLYLILRPFSDSMLVIWCSMVGKWGVWLSRYNSLSYDIYLFHFPIIQVLVATGVVAAIGSYGALFVTIGCSVALAAFCWFVIDRPILQGYNPIKRMLNRA